MMIRLSATQNASADLVHLFRQGLAGSRLSAGESVIIYADTFTTPQYPAAFLAAARDLGADAFQIVQPMIPFDLARGIGRARPSPLMIEAMKGADLVIDLTTGGMLYSNEQTAILAAGTRILRVREPEDCRLLRRTARPWSWTRPADPSPRNTAWRTSPAVGIIGRPG
jgi:2,5-dihydroxypyridine 5,6-dioxygenase